MTPPVVFLPRKGAVTATGAVSGLAFLVIRKADVAAGKGNAEIDARTPRLRSSAGGALEVMDGAGTFLFPCRTDWRTGA